MKRELSDEIDAFLKEHNTLTLATVGDDGMPWAATVFFVNDGLDLWWMSKPDVRHSVHIARHPRIAVAINQDSPERGTVRGFQAEGRAEMMGAPTMLPGVLARYVLKFPSLGDVARPSVALARMLFSSRIYRFVPARAVFVDQTGGKAIREEIDFGASALAATR